MEQDRTPMGAQVNPALRGGPTYEAIQVLNGREFRPGGSINSHGSVTQAGIGEEE
jgi:hypothetical protein